MSQPLIVSVPHSLGRQEARRDTLNFSGLAMWQRITGRIEASDDAVRVEIELPWVMQLLRDTIAKRVRRRDVALLGRPPGEE